MNVQARRSGKAIAGLVVCMVVIVLVDMVGKGASSNIFSAVAKQATSILPRDGPLTQVDSKGEARRDWSGVLRGVSDGGLSDQDAKALDEFASEVISLEGYQDLRIDRVASVVGFTARGAPAESFAEVTGMLKDQGWTAVPSGSETQGSFVRPTGSPNWVYMSCVSVGNTTSVVVQYASNEGKGGDL